MIDREEDEDNVGMSELFAEPENPRKLKKGLELQVMHPLLLNLDNEENNPQPSKIPEELKQIKLTAEIQQQSEITLVEEDNHQTDETENIPLWSMNFDDSCTRINTGVGV